MIMVCFSLFAQYNHVPQGFFNPNFQLNSLLNPNKVKINHSFSFGTAVSSNGYGLYESAYTNHIKYNINPKLNLKLDLSFVNAGTMTHQNYKINGSHDNKNYIIPSFSMEYKPTDNTRIIFEYRQVQGNPWLMNSNQNNDWRN